MGSRTANGDSPIPIVDFGPFLNGSSNDQKEIAKQIDVAFSTVGFVYIKNHGVAQKKIDECFRWSAEFYALPIEKRLLAEHPPGFEHHRGYSTVGREKVFQKEALDKNGATMSDADADTLADAKETYEIGNKSDTMQPNIWPPEDVLPGFHSFMEDFFDNCSPLVHRLLRCLALALDLDDIDSLSKAHDKERFQLRLSHYPAAPLCQLQERAGARIAQHSDFGSLTLLFQDSVGGLEVEDASSPGTFKPAPPIEGTCLVNMGDQMMRWSNDRWKSTVHRVGPPPGMVAEQLVDGVMKNGEGEIMCRPRYSIPFFATANFDAELDALPGCWSEVNPKKYEKCTVMDFVMERMATLY